MFDEGIFHLLRLRWVNMVWGGQWHMLRITSGADLAGDFQRLRNFAGECFLQCGAPKRLQISIVTGVYKPTYDLGAPHCNVFLVFTWFIPVDKKLTG